MAEQDVQIVAKEIRSWLEDHNKEDDARAEVVRNRLEIYNAELKTSIDKIQLTVDDLRKSLYGNGDKNSIAGRLQAAELDLANIQKGKDRMWRFAMIILPLFLGFIGFMFNQVYENSKDVSAVEQIQQKHTQTLKKHAKEIGEEDTVGDKAVDNGNK